MIDLASTTSDVTPNNQPPSEDAIFAHFRSAYLPVCLFNHQTLN